MLFCHKYFNLCGLNQHIHTPTKQSCWEELKIGDSRSQSCNYLYIWLDYSNMCPSMIHFILRSTTTLIYFGICWKPSVIGIKNSQLHIGIGPAIFPRGNALILKLPLSKSSVKLNNRKCCYNYVNFTLLSRGTKKHKG